MSSNAVDRFIKYALRRTYGRTCWKAGIPLETIKELMGHESVDTTIRYLGIRLDDMTEAMQKLSQYQKSPIFPEKGHFEV
jgi:integrase